MSLIRGLAQKVNGISTVRGFTIVQSTPIKSGSLFFLHHGVNVNINLTFIFCTRGHRYNVVGDNPPQNMTEDFREEIPSFRPSRIPVCTVWLAAAYT
jgi:hypothetical protein